MSYSIPKRITVEYTDHEAQLEQIGNSFRAVSIPVTRYMDIDVNVNVNTDPFDYSVDQSVYSLGELTGAITGFKIANVAAKKANEQAVVGRVTSGFMNMIEMNINLQNAGMESDMRALGGELTQQCNDLNRKHEVMNNDFNRIKSRYISLFDTINNEFKNRIQALVKPCFDFLENVNKVHDRKIDNILLPMAIVGSNENDSARIAIQTSKLKQNAAQLIASSKDYINDNNSLNRAIATFSVEGNEECTYFAPAVIVSEYKDETKGNHVNVYKNSFFNGVKQTDEFIKQQYSCLGERPLTSEETLHITAYFNKQLEDMNDGSTKISRIVDQIRTLFDNSVLRTFAK